MQNEFGILFDMPVQEQQTAVAVLIFYLVYCLVVMLVGTVQYVLQSVGLYIIAKRRGIRNPWLAWIPVGSSWMIGCISDQYQYVVKGKVRNKRKALLVLNILTITVGVVFAVCYGVLMGAMIGTNGSLEPVDALAPVLLSLLFVLVVAGISIALTVVMYIALYDLYTSCDPSNSVLFLILGIFIGIAQPLLIFICRKKDLGMPPRKPRPVVEAPQRQPPQPPKEPWENNPEV